MSLTFPLLDHNQQYKDNVDVFYKHSLELLDIYSYLEPLDTNHSNGDKIFLIISGCNPDLWDETQHF